MAVVDAWSVAPLTLIIALLACSRLLIRILIFSALVLALLALSVLCALRADAFVEAEASTLCATWMALSAD